MLAEVSESLVDASEGVSEGPGERVQRLRQGGRAGTENPQVELGEEESDVEAEGSDEIAGGVRNTLEEPFEPETAEVIAHSTAGVGGQIPTEERRDQRPEVAIAEAIW